MKAQEESDMPKHGWYNELVFDTWSVAFKPEWALAVVVQPGMEASKIQRAQAVLQTYVDAIRQIPLLIYDAKADEYPFSVYAPRRTQDESALR